MHTNLRLSVDCDQKSFQRLKNCTKKTFFIGENTFPHIPATAINFTLFFDFFRSLFPQSIWFIKAQSDGFALKRFFKRRWHTLKGQLIFEDRPFVIASFLN
jgi:hypothetical protein